MVQGLTLDPVRGLWQRSPMAQAYSSFCNEQQRASVPVAFMLGAIERMFVEERD